MIQEVFIDSKEIVIFVNVNKNQETFNTTYFLFFSAC